MTYRQDEIEMLVRQVVGRVLGKTSSPRPTKQPAQRAILDAEAVRQMPVSSVQSISADTLVTPLARQVVLERRIQFSGFGDQYSVKGEPSKLNSDNRPLRTGNRAIALGADHGGYQLKERIKQMLETADLPHTIIDCGTHSADSVDYPDYAYAVAQLVADGRAWRGVIIDGAGIGSCMAANKVPGIRAAMCYDQATAVNSREHNNANILTLGAGLIGPSLAQQIVNAWLTTDFGGGRHARRVDKINQIDKRFNKAR